MDIEKLTIKQREEAEEWLKSYKFVNICSKCKTMYGSDLKEKIEICPVCYTKFRNQNKK